MASISNVSSSNTSSLYGNRNVISGLASGMDTESMIENAVSGIRAKISGLLQKQTKISWQQEAYNNVSDKLIQFSRKYASYNSSTNLTSASYFNKAVSTTTHGTNASKVSATGKTSSNVVINSVTSLASASQYQLKSGGALAGVDGKITADSALDLEKTTSVSNLEGSMSLKYGDKTIWLNFKSDQVFANAQELTDEINRQLGEQDIVTSSGNAVKAGDLIKAEESGGQITFSNKTNSGNNIYISSATGKLNETLGKPDYSEKDVVTIDLSNKGADDLKTDLTVMDRISGKSMSFTLDGVGKKITLPTAEELAAYKASNGSATDEDALVGMIQEKLNSAFGAGKVKAGLSNDGELQFNAVKAGSNLIVSSEANKAMGLMAQETTFLNTSKTLGDILGVNGLDDSMALKAVGTTLKPVDGKDGFFTDEAGNLVKDGFRVNADGEKLYGLTINGEQVGAYTKDTTLESVMVDINANTDAGVNVTYSKTTNRFTFTSTETGAGHEISIGAAEGDLAQKLFGKVGGANTTYSKGEDAVMEATVNGSPISMTRSSNTFEIDGLSVTVNGTFNLTNSTNSAEAVTFTTKADTDKLVETIKSFVTDYNDMIKTLHDSFSTTPAVKSNKSRYEPLTDDDMEGMSDSAIESYNEKAKQGILFGDSDLSSLYSKLTSAISSSGADGVALRNMGISTSYSQGLTTISLDENALRETLDSNPDAVRDAFTKVAGEGSATNGLMAKLKNNLDTYASTEGAFKGVLVKKAGSKYSATSLLQNTLKTQIETYDEQIEKWQTKLSDKVDYYTSQFTRLEQLISQMNSQSSSLQSLMGGG